MTENFKILGKYIKDLSSETPNVETFLFVRDRISSYQLDIDISSKALKNKMIEVLTTFKFLDKEKNEQLNAFIGSLPLYFMEFIGVLFICAYFYVNLQQGVSKSDLIFNIGLLTYGSLRVLAYFKVITSNLSLRTL